MDFKLTDEQRDFVSTIRDFCERECCAQEKRDQFTKHHTELHNQALYDQRAELGWLGITIPEEYGGSGGTMLDACLFMDAETEIELCLRKRPALCLVEHGTRGGGLRVVRKVSQRVPETRVVVLSATADRNDMIDVIRAGGPVPGQVHGSEPHPGRAQRRARGRGGDPPRPGDRAGQGPPDARSSPIRRG